MASVFNGTFHIGSGTVAYNSISQMLQGRCVSGAQSGGDCKIPGPPPTGAPESVSLGIS